MLNLLRLLLIAGNETTSNLIGNGVLGFANGAGSAHGCMDGRRGCC